MARLWRIRVELNRTARVHSVVGADTLAQGGVRMRKRQQQVNMAAAVVAAVLLAVFALWWFHVPFPLLPPHPIVLTEKDQGRIVNLFVGQTIEVRLPSNAYARRTWVVGRPLPFLANTGDVTFTGTLLAAKPGDGYQSTTFTAIDKGSGPLLLGYVAENNQNAYQPAQSFSVSVNVR
jgi:hypothetical protein